MDGKSYNVPELSAIVDFIQPIKVKSGKLESKLVLGASRTFGNKNSYTTARMKESTNFKVMGPDLKETKGILALGIDYEQTNGVFYNTDVELDFGKQSKNEVYFRTGGGYRF